MMAAIFSTRYCSAVRQTLGKRYASTSWVRNQVIGAVVNDSRSIGRYGMSFSRRGMATPCSSSNSGDNENSSGSSSRIRSEEEIENLVEARVAERDGWEGPGQMTLSQLGRMLLERFPDGYFPFIPSKKELDEVFPVLTVNWNQVANPPEEKIQITWLGHSSLLVQMNGLNILADPVFNERPSPFQWAGPLRYRPPPCTLQELVENVKIDFVCVSHNHYDHLCYETVQFLAAHDSSIEFVVPLGLRDWMYRYAVSTDHVVHEMDWRESIHVHPDLKLTCIPMKHWSNRIGDRDKTLWCGYVMEGSSSKFLFPGDTAWFDGLYDIGTEYGPFDMAAIPIGAYEPREFMESNHINVDEAVRMKTAIQAKKAVPIHWGTFPLTTEPVMEPREKLVELMGDDKDSFAPWLIGETRQS